MMKISPSILSADLANLAEEVKTIESSADMIHIDVMDGVFVPNISFGIPVVKSLRKHTNMLFDVHLMIVEPEKYIDEFIKAGADLITFHYEATDCAEKIIDAIHAHGKMAGISIKPATPVSAIEHLLHKLDLVLIMTVEPGFGGQKLMDDQVKKIKELKAEISKNSLKTVIEVDGGVNGENAKILRAAGADILVAGSYVFGSADRKTAIESLK